MLPATDDAGASIRRGDAAMAQQLNAQPSSQSHNLPPQPTSFVGRSKELAELQALLRQPDCRLLTLAGLGGSGKTRLAVEAAAQSQAVFSDGVAFVPLQGVDSHRHIPAAIAETFSLPLHGQSEAWAQIAAALHARDQLLILDNFEHLIDGAGRLVALLAAAPRLRLLVTSREALRLQEEWLFPLEGLDVPATADATDVEAASAVQLFVARARQVRRDFDPNAERAAVAQICRLVAGMPLAIELAATWTLALSCAEIAAEIEHNLAFLETTLRNVPSRHRSMRAVFDQSWARLAEPERAALARLAVFRGGFTRDAAEQVAEATLPILARLVECSLLQHAAHGRYQLHELVRQYAEQRLHGSPDEAARTQAAYGGYYARFLAEQFALLTGGQQRAAIAAVEAERENIRSAWPIAIQHMRGEVLRRAAHILSNLYFFCGPYQEGIDAITLAIDEVRAAGAAPEDQVVLAALLVELSSFDIRIGQLTAADAHLAESIAISTATGATPRPGIATDPAIGLGVLALIRGDYMGANQLAEQVRARSEAHGLMGNLPYAWYLRTEAALSQSLHTVAQYTAQQALSAARQAGDEWLSAYVLTQLGQIAAALGQSDPARQCFQESFAIREAFGDPQGMAFALLNLGHAALRRGAVAEAAELYERSFAIAQRIDDRGGMASALDGLGAAACSRGAYDAAREHFHVALEIAAPMQYLPAVLSIAVHVGELLLAARRLAALPELLPCVLRHPAGSRETSDLAQRLLMRCEELLPAGVFAAALACGQHAQLDTVVERLLRNELNALNSDVDAGSPVTQNSLAEPLSERELEILRLIAEGLTNQAIADRLILSLGTIKWYTGQIYSKLDVRTRTQAIARARALKLFL
jgi:predicted ATPase/DNA-binding CsgD family transcriptional regulator